MLQGAYAKGQENKEQLKRDLEISARRTRAKREAEKIKEEKLESGEDPATEIL